MSAIPHEVFPAPEPERMLSVFWDKWGEQCGIPRGRLELMWRDAERHYDETLEQHNFDHALDVLWAGMELSDLCEENGQPVNRRLLVPAMLYHDAGYNIDQTIYGYATKEDFAADIWAQAAPAFQYDQEEIEAVKTLIKATGPGFEFKEPYLLEQKIMVRADIHNVGEDYEADFTPTTDRLLEEEIHKNGSDGLNFEAGNFVLNSVGFLSYFLHKDLKLGSFDPGDWQQQALENVNKLLHDLTKEAASSHKTVVELGTAAVKKVLGRN